MALMTNCALPITDRLIAAEAAQLTTRGALLPLGLDGFLRVFAASNNNQRMRNDGPFHSQRPVLDQGDQPKQTPARRISYSGFPIPFKDRQIKLTRSDGDHS